LDGHAFKSKLDAELWGEWVSSSQRMEFNPWRDYGGTNGMKSVLIPGEKTIVHIPPGFSNHKFLHYFLKEMTSLKVLSSSIHFQQATKELLFNFFPPSSFDDSGLLVYVSSHP